jgi:hypothetical protein
VRRLTCYKCVLVVWTIKISQKKQKQMQVIPAIIIFKVK